MTPLYKYSAYLMAPLALMASLLLSTCSLFSSKRSSADTGKYIVAVDLGLSVKWGSINLGANKPYEFGDYFMWGETTPATDKFCNWGTYKLANGSDWDKPRLNKYCPLASYADEGMTDSRKILEPEDDAARQLLGGKWRMPTISEWRELHANCRWEWTTINHLKGYKVTSLKDGYTNMSIFLPAAGYRYENKNCAQKINGYYWSATLDEYYPSNAANYDFDDDSNVWSGHDRCNGFSIRPVSD